MELLNVEESKTKFVQVLESPDGSFHWAIEFIVNELQLGKAES